jgi:hypothetical protein
MALLASDVALDNQTEVSTMCGGQGTIWFPWPC